MTQLRHKYLRRKSCRVSQLVVTWTHDNAAGNLRQGVNIRVVQTLMRHQSLTSTQVYTAVDDDERARAIAGLGWAA